MARAEADKAVAKKLAGEKTAAEKVAADKAAAASVEQNPQQQLAALEPNAPLTAKPQLSSVDLVRSVQTELRRVGCFTGQADGDWNASSRRSLEQFNKRAGMKLDVKLASLDALDAIKMKPARVCPLICDWGFRTDDDRCVKITCRAGYEISDDNACEKIKVKKPTAKRDELKTGEIRAGNGRRPKREAAGVRTNPLHSNILPAYRERLST